LQIRLQNDHLRIGQQPQSTPSVSGESEVKTNDNYSIGLSQNQPVGLEYFRETFGMRSLESYFLVRTQTPIYLLERSRPPLQYQDFHSKLKQHLLHRLFENLGLSHDGDDAGSTRSTGSSSKVDWVHVILEHNRIYSHKILRKNYTTYDLRREQDVIHINTPQCNIMLLNKRFTTGTQNCQHPYLYGRILGVFHANVTYVGPLPEGSDRHRAMAFRRIEFVWVHWYDYLGRKDSFSLDQVSPSSLNSPIALDFLDPLDILRGTHLIPQFSLGKSTAPLPRFRFSRHAQDVWKNYYINR
jgi:hypothetical protein